MSWPEPPANTPIVWQVRIGDQLYTYLALRIPGCGWYLTGQVTHALSWAALCYYFPPADGRFLTLSVTGQVVPG